MDFAQRFWQVLSMRQSKRRFGGPFMLCILVVNVFILLRAYMLFESSIMAGSSRSPTTNNNALSLARLGNLEALGKELELDCPEGEGRCEVYIKENHDSIGKSGDTDNIDQDEFLFRAQHRVAAPPDSPHHQQHFSGKENATFVSLARNEDLAGLLTSITQLEDRFNSKYHYDWVFLNDEPFSEQFIQSTSALVSGTPKYGVIGTNNWGYPEWIDQQKAAHTRLAMSNVVYGDSESYRHMCRYESGLFFDHPLLQEYRYYWRVEPDVSFHCDINYDVFKFMSSSNKKYGFTIALRELPSTIENLWTTVRSFLADHKHYLSDDSLAEFISDDGLNSYNLCHFWSNFEIADMDFYRSQKYRDFFTALDMAGGFYYERWGDAPIHSIAASLFLDRNELHFFDDIGYTHPPFTHCPSRCTERGLRCSCVSSDTFDWQPYSCLRQYFVAQNYSVFAAV